MNDEQECLYLAMRRLNKLLHEELTILFSDLDIHPSYAYILKIVEGHDYIKTKEIGRILSLDSSSVTRMVNKLIEQGYLLKGSEHSKTDIYLSDKGINILPAIIARWDYFHNLYETDDLLTIVNDKINLIISR